MTDNRRVLRLITRLNVGGPARQALLLTRELTQEFPTVLAAGSPSREEGELGDPLVPVRRVPLVRPLRPDLDLHAMGAVWRLMTENRPAIVHTHMAKAGSVGRLAALTAPCRPRTVHTFHGHVLEGYFTRAAQRTFVEIERQLARRTDVLVAVSPEIRDALLDLGVGRPSQYQVIPLGLDLSAFLAISEPSGSLRGALGIGRDVPLVGAFGRLVPIKSLQTLLEAISQLPGVHLALVGDGESRPALEARTRVLGLADRVHFTGWSEDVPAAMSDVDVVALTSRNEGTPVALIEAGAAGRPVVATRVGGVAQVVEDGVTGLLAAPDRPDEVASLLSRLLLDGAARGRMGAAGRQRVRSRFGHERLVADVRDLYLDLCRPREISFRSGRAQSINPANSSK